MNSSSTEITDYLNRNQSVLNPNIILRKGVYDKVAANIILNKFI